MKVIHYLQQQQQQQQQQQHQLLTFHWIQLKSINKPIRGGVNQIIFFSDLQWTWKIWTNDNMSEAVFADVIYTGKTL